MAVLTILGLYRYRNDLFDDLVLPDGVNKQVLIDNMIIELADMELIYPDPDVIKEMAGRWSRMQLKVWQRLAEAFDINYNPIWNVDG